MGEIFVLGKMQREDSTLMIYIMLAIQSNINSTSMVLQVKLIYVHDSSSKQQCDSITKVLSSKQED